MRSNEFSMCNIVVLLLSLCYKILMGMKYEIFISQMHTPNVTIQGITLTSSHLIFRKAAAEGPGRKYHVVNDNKFLSLK